MDRLKKLVLWDLIMQYKYGLVAAGIIMSMLWTASLMLLSPTAIPFIMPLVLLGDLATMGYMFMAVIIYFEKGQGSINAVIITPVRTKEYIKSKIISLSIYIFCVSFVVVYSISFIKGLEVNFIFLVLSIFITAVFYILLGLVMATKYNSFTDFLFPTGILFTPLMIPVIGLFNIKQAEFLNTFYYIWPTHGMILLMKGIFGSISFFNLIYAVSINLACIFLLYRICLKVFNRKIIGRRGDIDD